MQTEMNRPIDITIEGSSTCPNPFMARVEGRFVSPSGQVLRVPGFYAGDDRWVVRFMPTETGSWHYRIRSLDIPDADGRDGEFECTGSERWTRGNLRVSETHPFHFQFDDGTYHFMNAYECDWLWALDLDSGSIRKTEEFIRQIKSHRFNTIIMNAYAHDSRWTPGTTSEFDYGPPAAYAWEGTNESPDHTRLNGAFFDHFDRVVEHLYRNEIMIHLFFKVYNKDVNYPVPYSPEDDLYFRYITARYQGYPNIVWDFSKEAKNEPDKEYIRNRLDFIRAHDAYGHLVTVHDDPGYFTSKRGVRSVDFFTAQQHMEYFYSALAAKDRYDMPYFNSEFGYEHGPAGEDDKTYGVSQTPEEFIQRAYEVVMAGAYPAYYYTYTAWDVIDYRYDPPGAEYFGILYDFFTSIEWWKFEPSLEHTQPNAAVSLVHGEDELVVYPGIRDRERTDIFLTAPWDFRNYSGFWMDIFTGEKHDIPKGSLQANDRGLTHTRIPFESKTGIMYLRR